MTGNVKFSIRIQQKGKILSTIMVKKGAENLSVFLSSGAAFQFKTMIGQHNQLSAIGNNAIKEIDVITQ